jgi:hypothetical protein
MIKIILSTVFIFCIYNVYAQQDDKKGQNDLTRAENSEDQESGGKEVEIEFERPFNFFAAAGASYRFGNRYDVTISPVDYTVQFEEVSPLVTRFSLGLVWNPFPDKSEENVSLFRTKVKSNPEYKADRQNWAVALLINVFQLGFTAETINTSSPIDVGFGIGYRKSNLLILGTLEFTPMRTTRKYFEDQFNEQNKQLIPAEATEPVRSISSDDDTIFTDKIYFLLGIKIAYAFSKKQNNN